MPDILLPGRNFRTKIPTLISIVTHCHSHICVRVCSWQMLSRNPFVSVINFCSETFRILLHRTRDSLAHKRAHTTASIPAHIHRAGRAPAPPQHTIPSSTEPTSAGRDQQRRIPIERQGSKRPHEEKKRDRLKDAQLRTHLFRAKGAKIDRSSRPRPSQIPFILLSFRYTHPHIHTHTQVLRTVKGALFCAAAKIFS